VWSPEGIRRLGSTLRPDDRADPGLVSVGSLEWPGSHSDTKGPNMSIKLTETQRALLSAAAERGNRCLLLPPSLNGGAALKVAAKLIAAGLAREIKAKPEMAVWRRDEETGGTYALKLTAAGAKAIASDEVAPTPKLREESDVRKQAVATNPVTSREPRGGTKIAQVVDLIQRDMGATLDELIASTGWLPHTTRAALTGLRKRGYAVGIDRSDKKRGSTYRIGGDVEHQDAEVAAAEKTSSKPALRLQKVKRTVAPQGRKAA
jgi:hypothetical protein